MITLEDARNADYNLSPSQFVDVNDKVVHRSLKEIMADLAIAKTKREEADIALDTFLDKLGDFETC